MSGYVYLIRNGADLYKIGITQNLEQRMKQLKPDKVVSTLRTEDFETLEKELHMRYRDYDQSGYNYWLGNLNNGAETRYELLLGFAESAENKTLFTEMTGFG